MKSIEREALLERTAARIRRVDPGRPILVGIDGISGAGKTTFTDELVPLVGTTGRQIIRASLDGFHRPRHERVARGELCPQGYYEDSFDYPALKRQLLTPLRNYQPGMRVNTALFDFQSEQCLAPELVEVTPSAVLLFEGVFLFRPELVHVWDMKVFVDISFETSLERGLQRDSVRLGGMDSTREKYEQRYGPGQRFYLESSRPKEVADILFCNEIPQAPRVPREFKSSPDNGVPF